MLKLTFVIRKRADISADEFRRYWWEQHGPLVASLKDDLRIARYVQVHTTSAPIQRPGGLEEPHDGVAELYWESTADFEAVGASEAGRAAGRKLVEDEAKFIDFARSSIAIGEERVVIE